jgi:hypothetical protein
MGYVNTAIGVANMRLNAAQVQQLAHLNAQLAQQQQAQRFQANLGQTVFETERMAKRVTATAAQDIFAAGILAWTWLETVAWVNPDMLTDFQAKRAFGDSTDALRGAWARLQADRNWFGPAKHYLDAMTAWRALTAPFGGDPAGAVQSAHATHREVDAHNRSAKKRAKVSAIVCAGFLLLMFVGGVAEVPALTGLGTLFMFGSLVISGGSLLSIDSRKVQAARQRAEEFTAAFDRLQAFIADPNGGPWLDQALRRHPLLVSEPIPSPPSSASAPAQMHTVEKHSLVERQIVVVRCRFCKQLTPVDGATCKNCGAPGFGS